MASTHGETKTMAEQGTNARLELVEKNFLELEQRLNSFTLIFENYVRKTDEFQGSLLADLNEDRFLIASELIKFKESLNKSSFFAWFCGLFEKKDKIEIEDIKTDDVQEIDTKKEVEENE